MSKLSLESKNYALEQLRSGVPCCPFCKATGDALTPSDNGPAWDEKTLVEAGAEDSCALFYLVYCGEEDRDFSVVYRASVGMPHCDECNTDFDVVASARGKLIPLTAIFEAHAECWLCGSELGAVQYEACGFRDEGKLGN
jgi:hypothetical protein